LTDYEKKENISLTAVITVLEKMDEKLDKIDDSLHQQGGICDRITKQETTTSVIAWVVGVVGIPVCIAVVTLVGRSLICK
jgi:hypothetical protein